MHAVRLQAGETPNIRNGGSDLADDGALYVATTPVSTTTSPYCLFPAKIPPGIRHLLAVRF